MSSQDGLGAPFLAQYLGFIVSLLSQIKTYFALPPLIYNSDLTLCLGRKERPDNLEGYDSFSGLTLWLFHPISTPGLL